MAEVIVFFLVGPALVKRLRPAGVLAFAATAGVVRWVTMASTTSVMALALVQPLHGFTFAALHLACMRLLQVIVPPHLAATAQALYALGAGAASALLTLASGRLYASLGPLGFMAMAILAVPRPAADVEATFPWPRMKSRTSCEPDDVEARRYLRRDGYTMMKFG